MANSDEINLNEMVGEAVKAVLGSTSVQNLLGPITKQLGLALGQWGEIYRFYQTENLQNICT